MSKDRLEWASSRPIAHADSGNAHTCCQDWTRALALSDDLDLEVARYLAVGTRHGKEDSVVVGPRDRERPRGREPPP